MARWVYFWPTPPWRKGSTLKTACPKAGYGPEWAVLLLHSAAEMALVGDDVFYREFNHLGDDAARLQAGQSVARGEKLTTMQVPGSVRSYIAETHWKTYRLPAG